MDTGLALVAFLIGAVVSLATSWVLVSRLERLGERLGLSDALLGMVAALAADAPEITAAVTAVAHHQRTIGAGVVLGSNVFNLAALLGLGAVAAGQIRLHRRVVTLGGTVAVAISVVCLITVLGQASADIGLALGLIVLVAYLVILGGGASSFQRIGVPSRWVTWLTVAVREEESELDDAIHPGRGTRTDLYVATGALLLVVAASAAMEQGASRLGRRYGITDIIVGALVLAAVTSLPNAVAAVYLARRGRGAATLSTAFNSNTINVIGGLLIPAVFLGLASRSTPGVLVAAGYTGLTLLTVLLAYAGRGLRRTTGLIIIGAYFAFVTALVTVS